MTNQEEQHYNSSIFSEIVKEMEEKTLISLVSEEMERQENILEDTTPQDITESIHINLNDETINKANCRMIAYGLHVDEDDDIEAYNQKNNPDKAIDIVLEYPQNNLNIEIYLKTDTKEWDSLINGKNHLSPEQMGEFFKTDFYSRMKEKLMNDWPCQKDKLFSELMGAIQTKKYCIDWNSDNVEDGEELDEGKIRRRNVDIGKPHEKNAAGKIIRSASGRKLVSFSDQIVMRGGDQYYSWPGGTDDKHRFKWSRWCDWKKQKPFLRCRFQAGSQNDVIGLSISLFEEDDVNRGWISYNLSLEPTLQYLTPQETEDILNLSIVRRFLKESLRRILPLLDIPDEEIFKRINNPEKCTLDDVRKTKRVIKNTLKAVREPRPNTFVYT